MLIARPLWCIKRTYVKIISFLSLFFLLTACRYDDFQETERYFRINQNEYFIGDTITITAIVSPLIESKDIRVYENYKNIQIWFTLVNPRFGMMNSFRTESTAESLPDAPVNEMSITKKKPLRIDYEVLVTEDVDSIYLSISSIDYKVSFDKNIVLDRDTEVRIHGWCNPINPDVMDSCEDSFEAVEIRIKEKTTPQHGV